MSALMRCEQVLNDAGLDSLACASRNFAGKRLQRVFLPRATYSPPARKTNPRTSVRGRRIAVQFGATGTVQRIVKGLATSIAA
jgi:hypothetical protein